MNIINNTDYAIAATEVLELLKNFNKEDVEKIPNEFIDILESKKMNGYKVEFDYSKPLEELELRKSTKVMLGMIYREYWCNDEERKEYDQLLRKNTYENHKILREKYNPDEIFKKNILKEEKDENIREQLVEVSESETWYKKLKKMIIKFLKIK